MYPSNTRPAREGLYAPSEEHDACGLAAVATLRGTPGHDIVELALDALENLEHRGAVGSDAGTGDGAGILLQVPHTFLTRVLDGVTPLTHLREQPLGLRGQGETRSLPKPGSYATGLLFLPRDAAERSAAKFRIQEILADERLRALHWRAVPVDASTLGANALASQPFIEQLIAVPEELTGLPGRASAQRSLGPVVSPAPDTDALERRSFRARKRMERELGITVPSFSARTIVYKGMVTTLQLSRFYIDLHEPDLASELAIVHSRYSTNTFPSWDLAQPMRYVAHNGEINTVKGNRNWMKARESQLQSELLGDIRDLFPICTTGGSDSASFDEVLELLVAGGRSLPHALSMMVPEAWETATDLPQSLRDFYEYHALLMEPWDGPAALVATDGRTLVATLDRNGLRPSRTLVTTDGLVVLASEAGVLDIAPERIAQRGRLRPGRLLVVDFADGRLIEDDEVKAELAALKPWGSWLEHGRTRLSGLPPREHLVHPPASIKRRQRTFGYTEEEIRMLLVPMARTGTEPISAMGTDTPIAVLAEQPRLLFDYFVQQFAQVTNPPLDSLREELVTSMQTALGRQLNLLDSGAQHAERLVVDFPVITGDELSKIQHFDEDPVHERTVTLRGLYHVDGGAKALKDRLRELCDEADRAVAAGAEFLVLSDRDSTKELAPIPSLLLTGVVHQHLIRQTTRTRVALILEAGDAREVHHIAVLLGYGAEAVNPYLALETVEALARNGRIEDTTEEAAVQNLVTALGKGILKVMSKMGISTLSSYCGAQTFEAIGLGAGLVDWAFTGTTSKLGGIGLGIVAEETRLRHAHAYPDNEAAHAHTSLTIGGEYKWRRGEAPHLFDPETIFKLQHATRTGSREIFSAYTSRVNEQHERLMTIRGMLRLNPQRPAVPLDEVEPVAEIVKRFATGAMSFGSISPEAHETLALAMNALGGKSNTGEGGENDDRLRDPSRRSKIKQVASGRFGVTSMYLTHAEEIQIKLAQGAKPGEGGQLPPHKMTPLIAAHRHSTPGVGLISPPPHHDIYSIEDLKQLIFDVKRANPAARISTKLVAQSGIGAVAAGVAKALSDAILVSGHDGGTGASPMNSLKHAGGPWELGLAETQQTLMLNGLRDRVVLQVDGQLKTGRDVVIAALLGAEEFGFATAPLVVSGCIMMRACHLDTCPVGVATQNVELRSRFTGQAQHVINFFEFIAEEVRELLAGLGYRSVAEAIGQSEALEIDPGVTHWKAQGLDLSPILHRHSATTHDARSNSTRQAHDIEAHFDRFLIESSADALEQRDPVVIDVAIRNTDRAVGTLLGHEVTKRFGADGLAPETIDITLRGSAGQSLGAFLPPGITLRLVGEANDYVAKGLSGGAITIRRPEEAAYGAANVIAGNVIGYGATSGELYIAGSAGERFLVRGSGAVAVVEGVGDHALEYLTGGFALILGQTGRNLGAGMSGGEAVILDLDLTRVNDAELRSGALRVESLAATPRNDALRVRVRELLKRHQEHTRSELAATLLDEIDRDPDRAFERFTHVIPRGYARVQELRSLAVSKRENPDGEHVWQQILEETHG